MSLVLTTATGLACGAIAALILHRFWHHQPDFDPFEEFDRECQ